MIRKPKHNKTAAPRQNDHSRPNPPLPPQASSQASPHYSPNAPVSQPNHAAPNDYHHGSLRKPAAPASKEASPLPDANAIAKALNALASKIEHQEQPVSQVPEQGHRINRHVSSEPTQAPVTRRKKRGYSSAERFPSSEMLQFSDQYQHHEAGEAQQSRQEQPSQKDSYSWLNKGLQHNPIHKRNKSAPVRPQEPEALARSKNIVPEQAQFHAKKQKPHLEDLDKAFSNVAQNNVQASSAQAMPAQVPSKKVQSKPVQSKQVLAAQIPPTSASIERQQVVSQKTHVIDDAKTQPNTLQKDTQPKKRVTKLVRVAPKQKTKETQVKAKTPIQKEKPQNNVLNNQSIPNAPSQNEKVPSYFSGLAKAENHLEPEVDETPALAQTAPQTQQDATSHSNFPELEDIFAYYDKAETPVDVHKANAKNTQSLSSYSSSEQYHTNPGRSQEPKVAATSFMSSQSANAFEELAVSHADLRMNKVRENVDAENPLPDLKVPKLPSELPQPQPQPQSQSQVVRQSQPFRNNVSPAIPQQVQHTAHVQHNPHTQYNPHTQRRLNEMPAGVPNQNMHTHAHTAFDNDYVFNEPTPGFLVHSDKDEQSNRRLDSKIVNKKNKNKKVATAKRDHLKRKAMKVYFGILPYYTLFPFLVGAVIMGSQVKYDEFIGYNISSDIIFLIGLFSIVLGIAWRFLFFKKTEDQQVDEWTSEDLKSLEKRAISHLQVPEQSLLVDPVVLLGLPDIDATGASGQRSTFGEDGILRYTPRALTVICFSVDRVYIYDGAVNIASGKRIYENSREFQYLDVTHIGIMKTMPKTHLFSLHRISSLAFPWKWPLIEIITQILAGRNFNFQKIDKIKEYFQISLNDGSQVRLVLRDSRMLNGIDCDEIPYTTDDRIIRMISDFIISRRNDQMSAYSGF